MAAGLQIVNDHTPELFHDNLERILGQILQLASGNFEARLPPPSDAGTTLDALAVGLNMLAEELGSSVREREYALGSLGESEKKFRAITDTALDAVIMINDDGRITLWNPAAEKIFGFSTAEATGKNVHMWLAPPAYRESYKKNWPRFRDTGRGPVIGATFEAKANSKDRGTIPIELSVSSAHLNGKWHAIGIARDITGRKAMEKSVAEEREMLRIIDYMLSSFIGGIDTRQAFDLVLVELLKLSGSAYGFLQDRHIDADGKSLIRTLAVSDTSWNDAKRSFWTGHHPDDCEGTDCDCLNATAFNLGEVVITNVPPLPPLCNRLPMGQPGLNNFLGLPLKRGDKTIGAIGLANRAGGFDEALVKRLNPFLSAVAEIVEAYQNEEARRKSERRMERMANFDGLTGLPNRSLFRDRLQQATKRAKRYAEDFALLLLDLDHFKDVNDTLGHPVGDALLFAVGKRLQTGIRESDIVARLGGDEFAILQLNPQGAEDVAGLAERLIALLAEPFDIEGHRIHTETSIGIALFTPADSDPTRLLSRADTALYRAKAAGRHRYCFHDAQVEAELLQRVLLLEELHEAIAQDQFTLCYQPQIDTRAHQLVGLEALLRWNHPKRGLLGPRDFIHVAETSGILLEIDAWVLRQACEQMSRWIEQDLLHETTLGINLSPLQFKTAEFERGILAVLERFGLAPHSLELELTERSLAERPEAVAGLMRRLTDRGIRFSIDDFGTGYSSLQYLKKLPACKIKVAQEFVRDMLTDSNDASIVRAIIRLGQELGRDVIAEGVEIQDQLTFLQDKGCFLFQGYLFGRPLPAAELTEHFRKGAYVLPDGSEIPVL